MSAPANSPVIDAIDRRIIAATQEGLPLTPRPYTQIAEQLELDADDVIIGVYAKM